MRAALMVPCYVDQFYPAVADAARRVLERHGCEVVVPKQQTCCGQPMLNSGFAKETLPVAKHCCKVFADFEYVVCPSGSCTAMVREHYRDLWLDDAKIPRVFEFCEFLHDVVGVREMDVSFPHRVGIHQGCHGLRELRLAQPSESFGCATDKTRALLSLVRDIELVNLDRPDECCGFGGLFAVSEEAVSVGMGRDRVACHERAHAEIIASGDMSCLMHLEGIIRREHRAVRVAHVAQILAGDRV
ncbi:MAG: (Fe-S)-binding protein [Candidatus Hydrogenedens sp.]|nr:(Fe-S)-binding protein [Candidatus Hydrogenedens sp.]